MHKHKVMPRVLSRLSGFSSLRVCIAVVALFPGCWSSSSETTNTSRGDKESFDIRIHFGDSLSESGLFLVDITPEQLAHLLHFIYTDEWHSDCVLQHSSFAGRATWDFGST
eukprot:1012486-Amphidinium_carterae.1